jgi:hypothetical protein
VSDATELERAVSVARATVDGPAPGPREDAQRLSAVGARAVDTLRRFEAHPASGRPPEGAQDDLGDSRHDVRAAAQTVLAQLELIRIAWDGWKAAQRAAALTDLERAADEADAAASLFLQAAGRTRLRP